jgi:hypothetical protein
MTHRARQQHLTLGSAWQALLLSSAGPSRFQYSTGQQPSALVFKHQRCRQRCRDWDRLATYPSQVMTIHGHT